ELLLLRQVLLPGFEPLLVLHHLVGCHVIPPSEATADVRLHEPDLQRDASSSVRLRPALGPRAPGADSRCHSPRSSLIASHETDSSAPYRAGGVTSVTGFRWTRRSGPRRGRGQRVAPSACCRAM